MPAYKDENKNSWTSQFYYKDWQGTSRKKKRRGFQTKREALDWESEFLKTVGADITMTMESFVETYFSDKKEELKARSIKNKRYMIDVHIIPYFGSCRLNSITPADIIQWQNKLREKNYSQTYLRMIQNQLTALFNHAHNIYGLHNNPCKKVKKMGKAEADRLDFWTKEEYEIFIGTINREERYFLIFEILFWTGCREGELLALTKSDINLQAQQIRINKTYHRANREDVITTPKTEQSVRVIDIPGFLADEIQGYLNKFYELPDTERIFPIVPEAIQHKMKRQIVKAGVKKIRVHDIRHSHVAFLIHKGVDPLIIKERLGHKDIKITLNTYGHLYPNQQRSVADMLNLQK